MAGSAFMVTKKVSFHNDRDYFALRDWMTNQKQFLLCKFNFIDPFAYFEQFQSIRNEIDVLLRAAFLPNVRWWGNTARSWMLKTLTFRIIGIYWFIYHVYILQNTPCIICLGN